MAGVRGGRIETQEAGYSYNDIGIRSECPEVSWFAR